MTSLSEAEMSADDVATARVVKEGSGLGHQGKTSSVCFALCIFALLCGENEKYVWGR